MTEGGSDLKKVFGEYDADGSGDIDKEEMMNALDSMGVVLTEEALTVLFKAFDKNGNSCDYNEFCDAFFDRKSIGEPNPKPNPKPNPNPNPNPDPNPNPNPNLNGKSIGNVPETMKPQVLLCDPEPSGTSPVVIKKWCDSHRWEVTPGTPWNDAAF